MLVLTLKREEAVVVGEDGSECEVKLLHLSGGQVKLGFTAPRHVPIDRQKIRIRKRREQERQAS